MAFFTGYGAGVVRFFRMRRHLLRADWSLDGTNRPGQGRDEETSTTDQQAVHSGAGGGNLWASSPLFYLAPLYDPPG